MEQHVATRRSMESGEKPHHDTTFLSTLKALVKIGQMTYFARRSGCLYFCQIIAKRLPPGYVVSRHGSHFSCDRSSQSRSFPRPTEFRAQPPHSLDPLDRSHPGRASPGRVSHRCRIVHPASASFSRA
jgi:hypothetical protein